ncbi:MAG: zinc ribbon domain-containing protein [Clostridia bacterium]|nr:zinc ribbon domain-containing protein [Clostridia bacterium]
MEVYKKFTDALNSIDPMIIYWEFPESNEIYDRNALLNLSDKLEQIFNPEGFNYYLPLPDGEIRLLMIRENYMMPIFKPCELPKPKEAPADVPAAPTMNFCRECGSAITPGATFCLKCGAKLK